MSSFEIKYWKIRGNVPRFHQISVTKICFRQFSPIFFRTKINQQHPSPEMKAHFRPGRFADLSATETRRKNPENSVNSRIVEGGGREIKIYIGSNARWIGIRAISFRKRALFFHTFQGMGNFARPRNR